MKTILLALPFFVLISLLTPYFFKQLPFLTLPTLGILLVLILRRDLQDLA